jgi:hypothetical protein
VVAGTNRYSFAYYRCNTLVANLEKAACLPQAGSGPQQGGSFIGYARVVIFDKNYVFQLLIEQLN